MGRNGPPVPLPDLKRLSLIDGSDKSSQYSLSAWIDQARKAQTAADTAAQQSTGADDETLERMFVALRRWAGCVAWRGLENRIADARLA